MNNQNAVATLAAEYGIEAPYWCNVTPKGVKFCGDSEVRQPKTPETQVLVDALIKDADALDPYIRTELAKLMKHVLGHRIDSVYYIDYRVSGNTIVATCRNNGHYVTVIADETVIEMARKGQQEQTVPVNNDFKALVDDIITTARQVGILW